MNTEVTRTIEEQLSAFLDGELPDEELDLLVRRLEKDSGHRATIARYALIGNVLRNEPVPLAADSFRARVMAAIETGEESVEVASATGGFSLASGWLRPAAAAAVLVLAVGAGVNMDFSGESPAEGQVAAVAQSAGIAPDSPVAAAPVVKAAASGSDQPASRPSRHRERLTSYFVSHGEYARSFNGPLADSRIFVQQARFEE